MSDIFFFAQIGDIAKRSGWTVTLAQTREAAVGNLEPNPALVIFDLNSQTLDPLGIIGMIKANPETAHVATMGFVSHVNVALRQQAEAAGCDIVVARSAFAQTLPETLRSLAAV